MNGRIAGTLRGKRVFVTGHTGFKGSWLALWLHRLGAEVTGYSLGPPTDPSNFAASGVRDLLHRHHEADLRDHARLSAALNEARPDVVFHLAAQALVRRSYVDPRETFEVNVMGTANVLDAVRVLKRPCVVVVVTSDKCYENREQVWGYRECDPMGGSDPYSASKGAAEIVTAAFRRSFFDPAGLNGHGVKLASVRAGNVIGGGDWAQDRIVPDIVRALARGLAVSIRNPAAIRPWQHVLEPLGAYLLLASRMLVSDDAGLCGPWNFGPSESEGVPVRRLVERFCEVWGSGTFREDVDPKAVHEAHMLRLSIDKAAWELGWRPRWRFDQALVRTAEWYRAFYSSKGSMLDRCREDIDAYEKEDPS